MKKILFMILSIALIYSCSYAELPPRAVQKTFEEKFPNAKNVNWTKETLKKWEAAFTFGGEKITANFAKDGTWLETEKPVKISELPGAVSEAINVTYQGWTITAVDKTESLEHGTMYEADLKKRLGKKEVAFKEDGTPVAE
jgi:hypothetical protein